MKVCLYEKGPLNLRFKQRLDPWGEYVPKEWDWTLQGIGFRDPDKDAVDSQLASLYLLRRPNLEAHVVIGAPDEDQKTITIPPEGFVVSIIIPRLSSPLFKQNVVVFEYQGGQLFPYGRTLEDVLNEQVAAIQKEIEDLTRIKTILTSTEML
jgi:hypothetical protein